MLDYSDPGDLRKPQKDMLKQKNADIRKAPGMRQRFRLPYGRLRRARRDLLRFYCEATREFGDVFRWEIGPTVVHSFRHPDHVAHVLSGNMKNYPRSRLTKLVRLVTGDGLVVSEGGFWLRQRRLVQPAFHRDRVAALVGLMTRATTKTLDRWHAVVDTGKPLDVSREMIDLALRIVGESLFSRDISASTDAIGQAVSVAMEYVNYRMTRFFTSPLCLPTPRAIRFRRAIGVVDQLICDTIRTRRLDGEQHDDLLGMLLEATDEETGVRMSDRQVRHEAATFIGAGHETTAMALAWTWFLLSQHPEIDRRLRSEVNDVLNGRIPTLEDIPQLKYVRMVIEESMRLYPPVWALSREAIAEDEVGGFTIPPKSLVVISPYVTHRHPEFWPNPEGFDPDRFSQERAAARHRFAYFPFGGGPHICIGRDFALQEAIIIVAMTVQRYRLELVGGHPILPDPVLTLRPKHGVLMTIRSTHRKPTTRASRAEHGQRAHAPPV